MLLLAWLPIPLAAATNPADPTLPWVTEAVSAPRLQFRTFASAVVGTKVSYHLYTPPAYEAEPERRFPVVYWLHGTGGGLAGIPWLVAHFDEAIRAGRMPPALVVFVNGLPLGMYCDWQDGAAPVETVIMRELLPQVDANFRTIAAREGRLIEGFSMGGYGAARLGLKFPEVFGAVSILAGGPLDLEFQGPRAKGNPVERERILKRVFGGDLEGFKAQSPLTLAEQNADAIRNEVLVRLAVGDRDFTAGLNRAFAEHLRKLNIPHTFTRVPGVEHQTPALLKGLGEANWEFYRTAFANPAGAELRLKGRQATRSAGNDSPAIPYRAAAGPFEVVTVDEVLLRDAKRNKELPVFVSYPKGEGKSPVVVFSHGALGAGDMGFPIVQHWTSHGYIVLCPTHADSLKLRRAQGRGGAGETLARIRGSGQDGWDDNWLERPRDISFVLDSLDELETQVPAMKGKLDRDRLAVGGHSLGAYTAQLAGGATVRVPGKDEPQSVRDPRLKAILQLSGQGTGQQGLHQDSWKDIRIPMVCVTGSRDFAAQGQEPIWRREPFALSPLGGKYFLFIEGAHHGSFTGRTAEGGFGGRAIGRLAGHRGTEGGGTGDQAVIFEWVKQVTTAFWDAALKQDAAAEAWLGSEALAIISGGKANLELAR